MYRNGVLDFLRQEMLQKHGVFDGSKINNTVKQWRQWSETPAQKAKWMEQYERLKAYRDFNGHCNVPSNYAENQTLATWCVDQRMGFQISSVERVH